MACITHTSLHIHGYVYFKRMLAFTSFCRTEILSYDFQVEYIINRIKFYGGGSMNAPQDCQSTRKNGIAREFVLGEGMTSTVGGGFNSNVTRASIKENIDNLFYIRNIFMYVHYENLFNKQFSKNIWLITHITIIERVIKVRKKKIIT